ncbi:2Fe-2S iron-sulfur cluster binding domain-containing protein [bacterium]|nr:2Fe-2S iron-sulfur cluster binding domain-containing protein [bacterium]
MPKVTIENGPSVEVADGTKLVLAIEDAGCDILHRCGGNSRCTTCRVEVIEGDAGPIEALEAERIGREADWPSNRRLSCQVRVNGDLTVKVLATVSATGNPAGPRPID